MKSVMRLNQRVMGLLVGLSLAVLPFAASLEAREKVVFTPGWIFYGIDLAWFTAQDKGYYAQEGLDVTIIRGYGGSRTAKDLVAGKVDIGGTDPGNLLRLRAKGAAFKVVGMWFDRPPYAILTLGTSPIHSLKDLEGRSIGTPSWDSTWSIFPAAAKLNGVNLKKIKQIEVSPAVREAGLLAGNYDASTNFVTNLPVVFKAAAKQGKKIRYFVLAKHGLDIYANSIVTSEKLIQSKPGVVRGFVHAIMKGAAYAMEHPDEATAILLKYVPTADRDSNRRVWDITVDLWLTPDAKRLGLGHMTEEKWDRTQKILSKNLNVPIMGPAKSLYTNEFLPKLFPKRGARVFPAIF